MPILYHCLRMKQWLWQKNTWLLTAYPNIYIYIYLLTLDNIKYKTLFFYFTWHEAFFSSLTIETESESHNWLCDPMDYTVHGILQARILESVAFPFSKGSSQPRDWTQVSHIASHFNRWASREAQEYWSG